MEKYCEINKFTEDDLDRFISFSQDSSKIHSSYEYATALGFEDRVCHGILTLSPISRILGMLLPGEGYVILEIKSKFHKPIYPNQEIKYSYEVTSKNESLGIMSLDISLINQSGDIASTTKAVCKRVKKE